MPRLEHGLERCRRSCCARGGRNARDHHDGERRNEDAPTCVEHGSSSMTSESPGDALSELIPVTLRFCERPVNRRPEGSHHQLADRTYRGVPPALRRPERRRQVPLRDARPRGDADGVVGWGEAVSMPPETSLACKVLVEQGFAPLLAGRDASRVRNHWQTMREHGFWAGIGGVMTLAASAVDTALWDVAGKLAGQPVHALIGGKVHDSLPACSSVIWDTEDIERTAEQFARPRGRGLPHAQGRLGAEQGRRVRTRRRSRRGARARRARGDRRRSGVRRRRRRARALGCDPGDHDDPPARGRRADLDRGSAADPGPRRAYDACGRRARCRSRPASASGPSRATASSCAPAPST